MLGILLYLSYVCSNRLCLPKVLTLLEGQISPSIEPTSFSKGCRLWRQQITKGHHVGHHSSGAVTVECVQLRYSKGCPELYAWKDWIYFLCLSEAFRPAGLLIFQDWITGKRCSSLQEPVKSHQHWKFPSQVAPRRLPRCFHPRALYHPTPGLPSKQLKMRTLLIWCQDLSGNLPSRKLKRLKQNVSGLNKRCTPSPFSPLLSAYGSRSKDGQIWEKHTRNGEDRLEVAKSPKRSFGSIDLTLAWLHSLLNYRSNIDMFSSCRSGQRRGDRSRRSRCWLKTNCFQKQHRQR